MTKTTPLGNLFLNPYICIFSFFTCCKLFSLHFALSMLNIKLTHLPAIAGDIFLYKVAAKEHRTQPSLLLQSLKIFIQISTCSSSLSNG